MLIWRWENKKCGSFPSVCFYWSGKMGIFENTCTICGILLNILLPKNFNHSLIYSSGLYGKSRLGNYSTAFQSSVNLNPNKFWNLFFSLLIMCMLNTQEAIMFTVNLQYQWNYGTIQYRLFVFWKHVIAWKELNTYKINFSLFCGLLEVSQSDKLQVKLQEKLLGTVAKFSF